MMKPGSIEEKKYIEFLLKKKFGKNEEKLSKERNVLS